MGDLQVAAFQLAGGKVYPAGVYAFEREWPDRERAYLRIDFSGKRFARSAVERHHFTRTVGRNALSRNGTFVARWGTRYGRRQK